MPAFCTNTVITFGRWEIAVWLAVSALISFSTSTFLDARQEGHPACEKRETCSNHLQSFSFATSDPVMGITTVESSYTAVVNYKKKTSY